MSSIRVKKRLWLMVSVICVILVLTSLAAYGDTEALTTTTATDTVTDTAGDTLTDTAADTPADIPADTETDAPAKPPADTSTGTSADIATDAETDNAAADTPVYTEAAGLTEATQLSAMDMELTSGTTYHLGDTSVSATQITMKVGGQDISTLTEVPRNSNLSVLLKYQLSNQIHLTGADVLSYTFPSQLAMNSTSGTVYSGTTASGTYFISGNVVTIQLDQAFLDQNGNSNITGQVALSGLFNLANVGGGGSTTFSFTGGSTVTIDLAEPSVQADKSADSSSIGTDGYIKYKIKVTSDGPATNVAIEDTLGANLSFMTGSATMDAATYTPAVAGQKITFTVPSVTPGNPVVIEYKVKVNEDLFYNVVNSTVNLTNTIRWTVSGSTTGTDSTTVKLSKNWISKSGELQDAATGKVKWTITYNAGFPIDITGSVFSDAVPEGSLIEGNITVTGSDGSTSFTIPANTDKKGFSYTVGTNSENGAQKFTVTYDTKLTPEYAALSGSIVLRNVAYLKNDNFTTTDHTVSAGAEVTRNNTGTGSTSYISKEVTDVDTVNGESTWKITVHVPTDGTAFKLTNVSDNVAYYESNTNPPNWWILQNSVSVTYADGTGIGIAPTYNWSYFSSDPTKAYQLNVAFGSNFTPTKDVVVTLKTKHDLASLTSLTRLYKNLARGYYNINGVTVYSDATASWTYTYDKLSIKKAAGSYRYDAETGKYLIDWTVTLNDINKDGIGDLDFTGKTVTVKDTLPAGLSYLDQSLAAKYNGTSGTAPAVAVTGSEITISPVNVGNAVVKLTYTTVVDPAILQQNEEHAFTNQATVYVDGQLNGTSSVTKTVSPQILTKAGAQGDYLINYTIEVNKAELDLDPHEDIIILSDVLQANLTLATTSVKVLDAATNSPLSASAYSVNYDSGTRKLSFILPDSTSIIVKYSVKLEGTAGSMQQVSNTATLKGASSLSVGTNSYYQVLSSSASVEIAKNAIRVKKIDADSITHTLPGAVFTLYSVSAPTGDLTEVASVTTGNDGFALFSNLSYDQIYCLKETTPPSLYRVDFDPYYFVVPGNDNFDWALIFAGLGISNYATRGGDILATDAKTDISFSKTSVTGTAELPGAVLTIYDADNSVVDSWISTDEVHHVIGKLIAGATYTLVEETAPGGYTVAESVEFTVNAAGAPQIVTMKDAPTDVTISKTSVTGTAELPGAKLTIYDADNEAVETWTSTEEAHQIVAKLIAGATYTLVEETAPDGYTVAEAIEFTVNDDGTPQTVTMKDAPTDVTFSKTSVTGTAELPGAKLTIYDADNEAVETWTSTEEAHQIVAKLIAGATYTLVEETAPDGYTVAEAIEFTVNDDGTPQTVTMKDAPTDVTFSKTSVTGTAELPGAKLTIYDADNEVVETWTSTEEAHQIVAKLIAGATYTLVEETAPDGYTVAEAIEFTVNDDGTPQTVTMKDAPTDVTISKTSVTGTAELPGAKLTIRDAENNVVETWTSGEEAHRIVAKLIAGATYTLVEETSPDGYTVAEAIEFTVNDDGTPQTVTMKDAPTDVTISKTSVTGTAELPGAKLTIRDAENNVVETWTSTEEAHRIVAKLIAGATYTLVEETAPDGYTVAEAIEFTVNDDGTPQTVTMKDAPTDVTISKTSVTGTAELPGAKLTIYDADNKAVETWVSTDKPHQVVAKLLAGATYTLVEETAPKGYTVAEKITFTVNNNGTPQTVTMKDAPTDVTISKVSTTSGKELPGAVLILIDANGNIIDTWTSTEKPHQIVAKLIAGATYTLMEKTAPSGYTVAEKITFTVHTDGTAQTVTMKDAPVTKTGGSTKTGDSFQLTFWLSLLIGSTVMFIAMVCLIRVKKRRA